MYVYKGEKYKRIGEVRDKYNLVGITHIMNVCNSNLNSVTNIIKKNNFVAEEILCQPSGKICKLYKIEDFKKIKTIARKLKKNEEVPKSYLDKKSFCEQLGITPATLNSIVYWCNDFNKYSKIFYINNSQKRFYKYDKKTLEFYQEKLNKYYNPQRNQKKLEQINKIINTNILIEDKKSTRNFKHHKITIDKKMLSKLLNTSSVYYKQLEEIYKQYSTKTVIDVSIMELHHIVPRFYVRNGGYYPNINNLENLIYLPPNIHFLVHLLEYKCALPQYENQFFSSCCIKTATLDTKKIASRYITEIIDLLTKAFLHSK